jgi:predicted nucleic acid-binding protein
MIAILDASAALRMVTCQDEAGAIAATIAEARLVLAPELFIAEVSNGLWRLVRHAAVRPGDADQALRRALDLPDRLVPMAALAPEALALATQLSHPIYDVFYLTLARREAAFLVTLDARLRTLATQIGVPAGGSWGPS